MAKKIKERYGDRWVKRSKEPMQLTLKDRPKKEKEEPKPVPKISFNLASYKLPEKSLDAPAEEIVMPLAQALSDLAYYLLQQSGYDVAQTFAAEAALKKVAKSLVLTGLHSLNLKESQSQTLYNIILEETSKALADNSRN